MIEKCKFYLCNVELDFPRVLGGFIPQNKLSTKYKGIPSCFNRNIKTRQVCLTFHFYLRPSQVLWNCYAAVTGSRIRLSITFSLSQRVTEHTRNNTHIQTHIKVIEQMNSPWSSRKVNQHSKELILQRVQTLQVTVKTYITIPVNNTIHDI